MKKDLTGIRFGKLVAIRPVGKYRTNTLWECICDCGVTKTVNGHDLSASSGTRSCGCYSYKFVAEKLRRHRKPYEWVYNTLRKCASKWEEFDISYDEFFKFTQVENCFYCGERIHWPLPFRDEKVSGEGYNLDRKDNNRGYTLDNVVVCCPICNRAKGNRYTFEEWRAMTTALRMYRRSHESLAA